MFVRVFLDSVYKSVAQASEEGSMTVQQPLPKPAVKQQQDASKSSKSQLALLVKAVKPKRQK